MKRFGSNRSRQAARSVRADPPLHGVGPAPRFRVFRGPIFLHVTSAKPDAKLSPMTRSASQFASWYFSYPTPLAPAETSLA